MLEGDQVVQRVTVASGSMALVFSGVSTLLELLLTHALTFCTASNPDAPPNSQLNEFGGWLVCDWCMCFFLLPVRLLKTY
jgi:hypothetical protein